MSEAYRRAAIDEGNTDEPRKEAGSWQRRSAGQRLLNLSAAIGSKTRRGLF